MKTKALAIFLALVMIVGLMPAAVFAEDPVEGVECTGECTHVAGIGNIHYDSVPDAVTAAKDNDKITVLKDHGIECSETWLTVSKKITIDLNGKEINATANNNFTQFIQRNN